MPKTELELRPVDFITVGTIGPKGQRVFHLQAGSDNQIVSFIIEKEQAWALASAIEEFLDDLDERDNTLTTVEMAALDMDLREPIQPIFRVAQMGLAYDEEESSVVLVAQEFTGSEEDEEEDEDAGVVRMWCTREQMRALSMQAMDMVESGRPSPKQNGRILYYWT
ncbi:MAG: DUF3090 family protein [Anaerolineae bacterium]|nr:DUF3090 family protein [Anaerolineae bacterium]MCA9890135.1 DUF3090 family protein [Anaerolineae bacterium]MCA9894699.1 DUF3090 family protein [Anaerolineae bacterium]MCB9458339.1 DUF3090 family protein [Anaerolineaceae bacterium]